MKDYNVVVLVEGKPRAFSSFSTLDAAEIGADSFARQYGPEARVFVSVLKHEYRAVVTTRKIVNGGL